MSIQQMASDKATTAVATAAVTINWWMPWLESASTIAALLVPIAGLVWLVVQIALKLIQYHGHDKDGTPRK